MYKYLAICITSLWALKAGAVLKIDITDGNVEPMPIAINELFDDTDNSTQLGKDLQQVIEQDLLNCGLFRPIHSAAFLEKLVTSQVPSFASWRQIGAVAVMSGKVSEQGGKITAEFRLWDPSMEEQIAGGKITISERSWRRLGHKIADEIYQRLTGDAGYFDTRILFVSETGHWKNRTKKLAIMDQDGVNYKELTDGSFLVSTPRFDPKSQRAIYMSYQRKKPQVYLLDINTGQQKILGTFSGMSFAPRFAPDGDHAIFSIAKNGTTDIYEIDLSSSQLSRLTNNAGSISTSPSYNPTGDKIVFSSDRGGTAQLYIMNRDGSGAHRISFGDGRYHTPVWSPRGDYIAFTKTYAGVFYIGIMRPDGTGERLLTSSWLDEGPTFAPNGRVIMFSRQAKGGAYKIYAVDITGFHERLIPTPYDASDPAWSPLL